MCHKIQSAETCYVVSRDIWQKEQKTMCQSVFGLCYKDMVYGTKCKLLQKIKITGYTSLIYMEPLLFTMLHLKQNVVWKWLVNSDSSTVARFSQSKQRET